MILPRSPCYLGLVCVGGQLGRGPVHVATSPPNRPRRQNGSQLNGLPTPATHLQLGSKDHEEYHTDELRFSSGMCKAGFAGDDAPRAVFRKSNPTELVPPPRAVIPPTANPCVG